MAVFQESEFNKDSIILRKRRPFLYPQRLTTEFVMGIKLFHRAFAVCNIGDDVDVNRDKREEGRKSRMEKFV